MAYKSRKANRTSCRKAARKATCKACRKMRGGFLDAAIAAFRSPFVTNMLRH